MNKIAEFVANAIVKSSKKNLCQSEVSHSFVLHIIVDSPDSIPANGKNQVKIGKKKNLKKCFICNENDRSARRSNDKYDKLIRSFK